jgi:antibiotic biosynthesis monooxygenase (ABM) superfamily enzyme
MISRHWTAIARPGQAERYVEHLRREIWPMLGAIPGFVRATVLRREVADGTEFRVVTEWESLAAIRAFAGADAEVAVVPPVVQAMMVRFDRQVGHYEVADTYAPGGPPR